MVLWYVRLRRAAKKRVYHQDLLRAERMAGPVSKVQNPVVAVRSAILAPSDIEEIKESRAQDDSLSETEEDE